MLVKRLNYTFKIVRISTAQHLLTKTLRKITGNEWYWIYGAESICNIQSESRQANAEIHTSEWYIETLNDTELK